MPVCLDCFQFNTALVQRVFTVPQRERKSEVHHHRQANDLGPGQKYREGLRLTMT